MKAAAFIKANYGKLIILAAALLLLSAVFGARTRMLLTLPLLVAIGAFSMFYHHFLRSPVNFEMIKLVTVVSSVSYGIPAGLFVGFSSNILGHIFAGKIDDTILTSIAGNALIAVVSGVLSGSSILVAGMASVLANYALIAPFIFLFGRNLAHASAWVLTNILFNLLLFSKVAPFLLKLL